MLAVSQTTRKPFRPYVVAARRPSGSRERVTDCWPDWSTTPADAEARAFAERNRPSAVFGEVVGILAVTAALVALMQIALLVLHIGA